MFETPSSFDPVQVQLTVHVPANESLFLPSGTRVNEWTLTYLPEWYPHWIAYPNASLGIPGRDWWTATFVNPDRGVVGSQNANSYASSIEPGALTTVTFPVYLTNLSGIMIGMSCAGCVGSLERSIE